MEKIPSKKISCYCLFNPRNDNKMNFKRSPSPQNCIVLSHGICHVHKIIIQVRDVYVSEIFGEYEKVKTQFEEPSTVLRFLEYFERTYLGKSVGASFKKARFPIPSWNHHESILTGASTTNNSSEGANSAWAHSLPTNASLWTVLATFREVRIYFCDLFILLICGTYS